MRKIFPRGRKIDTQIVKICLQVLNHKNQDIRPPAPSSTGGEVSTEQVKSLKNFSVIKKINFEQTNCCCRSQQAGAAPSPNRHQHAPAARIGQPSWTSSPCRRIRIKNLYIYINSQHKDQKTKLHSRGFKRSSLHS